MAGAGYKLFNTGDVLTAQQVNEYLQQQTVMVFANSTARTTALSGVLAEGMMSYLQDTNKVYVYDGSAWLDVSSEIPSQTGNSGKYLTTDGTNASWATISAGGMTSLATGSLSGTSTNISGISSSYRDLYLIVKGFYSSAADPLNLRFNSSSTGYEVVKMNNGSTSLGNVVNGTEVDLGGFASGDVGQQCVVKIYNYADDSSYYKPAEFFTADTNNTIFRTRFGSFMWRASKNAISSIQLLTNSATSWSGGTYTLYGVK